MRLRAPQCFAIVTWLGLAWWAFAQPKPTTALSMLTPDLRRAAVQQRSNFLRLPDGRILDRTVDVEFRKAEAESRKGATRRPEGLELAHTVQNVDWGFVDDPAVTVDAAPRWIDAKTGESIDAILVETDPKPTLDEAPRRVIQLIQEGEALIGPDEADRPGRRVKFHATGLPEHLIDGDRIDGAFLLAPNDPPTHAFIATNGARATLRSFQFHRLNGLSISTEELAQAILDGNAHVLVWKHRRIPDPTAPGHVHLVWESREVK